MRIARLVTGMIVASACVFLHAQAPKEEITVTGKLVRAMAIGGESTGWVVELDPAVTIGGKELHSIQVSYGETAKLEQEANKRVRATGKLGQRSGVETGEQPVLAVSSIEEAQGAETKKAAIDLLGTEWLLENLEGGSPDHGRATLAFPEAGKVAGNGSCNRFFGPAEIKGDAIRLGPLASTRMACAEQAMDQEAKYLEALQAAERFEWKDQYLLIHCKGHEAPLRFTRIAHENPATP
jgi:heat shock protein HslJ